MTLLDEGQLTLLITYLTLRLRPLPNKIFDVCCKILMFDLAATSLFT